MWIHLFNPFIRSRNWYHYLSHVIHDTDEAQRGWVAWAKLQSSWVEGLDSSPRSWSPEFVYQYCLSAEWEWENARIKPKSRAIIAERRVPGIQDQALPMSAKRACFAGRWEEGAWRRGVGKAGSAPFLCQQWFSLPAYQHLLSDHLIQNCKLLLGQESPSCRVFTSHSKILCNSFFLYCLLHVSWQ